jgi:hypothetical protein
LNLLEISSLRPFVEIGACVGATNTKGDMAILLLAWRVRLRSLDGPAPQERGAIISLLSEGVRLLLSDSCYFWRLRWDLLRDIKSLLKGWIEMLLNRSCILFLPPVRSVYFLEAASRRPLKKFKPVSDFLFSPTKGDSIDEVVLKLKCLANGFIFMSFLNSWSSFELTDACLSGWSRL